MISESLSGTHPGSHLRETLECCGRHSFHWSIRVYCFFGSVCDPLCGVRWVDNSPSRSGLESRSTTEWTQYSYIDCRATQFPPLFTSCGSVLGSSAVTFSPWYTPPEMRRDTKTTEGMPTRVTITLRNYVSYFRRDRLVDTRRFVTCPSRNSTDSCPTSECPAVRDLLKGEDGGSSRSLRNFVRTPMSGTPGRVVVGSNLMHTRPVVVEAKVRRGEDEGWVPGGPGIDYSTFPSGPPPRVPSLRSWKVSKS